MYAEFLVAPPGGFQWNPPPFLSPILKEYKTLLINRASQLLDKSNSSDSLLVHTHIHDFQGGGTQYDEVLGPDSFRDVYHDLFRIFFPGKSFDGPVPTTDGNLDFPVSLEGGGKHDINELSSGEKEVL